VVDRSDPLGKSALYWMPVAGEAADARTDEGPEHGDGYPRPRMGERPQTGHARPAGKHALFSEATPASEGEAPTSSVTDPLPPRGVLKVACSSCGSVTRVGLFEFLLLQFPFGAWLPRRTFDRWMTCPSCRRRTWTSVSLSRER
jgi:hypothetical protein